MPLHEDVVQLLQREVLVVGGFFVAVEHVVLLLGFDSQGGVVGGQSDGVHCAS